jgi:hypothetical protein
MLMNSLNSAELIKIFNSTEFLAEIRKKDSITQENWEFIKSVETSDQMKTFFVLKEIGDEFFTEKSSREDCLAGIRSQFLKEGQGILLFTQPAKNFLNGLNPNGSGVLIQEITVQRFISYLSGAMIFPMFIFQIDCIKQNKSIRKEQGELEKYVENKLEQSIANGKITREEANSRKDFEVMMSILSLADKIKLHLWAVILFVEAVWRTTIEVIAYAIHLMVPTYFENYRIRDREKMVQRQWQSLQIMAGFMFSLRALQMVKLRLGDEFLAMDDLAKVKRGTPHNGQITATGWTSDRYPKLIT